MNGQTLSTGRLVRPAYRTPGTGEIPSYLDTLEGELLLAQDENRQLKTRLGEAQAEYDLVVAQLGRALQGKPATVKSPSGDTTKRWVAGHVRLGDRFPIAMSKRTGIAAFIRRPLVLRSGAVLEPVRKAAVRGGRSCQFPDSSWLILSVLAQRAGAWVTRRELGDLLFPGRRDSSVRSAVLRARMTLETVQASADLETSGNFGVGWRLLLAEAR